MPAIHLESGTKKIAAPMNIHHIFCVSIHQSGNTKPTSMNLPNHAKAILALSLTFMVSTIGCNSDDKPQSPKSATIGPETLAAGPDTSKHTMTGPLNSSFLDELSIDTTTFSVLNDNGKNKVTFRFHITDPETLTLRAWVNGDKQNDYPGNAADPKFTMHNGQKTGISIGEEVDLGNLVLSGSEVNKILKKAKKEKCTFVLFRPLDPVANGGQIVYDILVTDTDPQKLNPGVKPLISPTTVITNPSPPKNSNGGL